MLKKLKISDLFIVIPVLVLIVFSIFVLKTLNPELFPQYYIYIIASFVIFILFHSIGYEMLSYFSVLLYVMSILFLILTYLLGTITRGTVRWLAIGPLAIQPSELIRPFLIIFFSNLIVQKTYSYKKHILLVFLILLPVVLIAIQPSLGVALITSIGLLSMYLYKFLNKKNFIVLTLFLLVIIPLTLSLLKPYQRDRLSFFLNPAKDSQGQGYNTIQSIITVGSGKIFGKGLGKGAQTQLQFLPEKHTDFVFASISEEMGLIGASVILLSMFILLYRLLKIIDGSNYENYKIYVVGIFTTLFIETAINVGMNLGILPITGVPLPLVSAGGSSLIATMISLSLVTGPSKK
ncbi:MAG TPA: FtsW/RodA/SpoVE family cell cycle protein [Patescibacteria group bacterium]|nr:FtsW/RodA/SpoVE family cell cycle protein [Patescibacteria group bacterium]